MAETPQFCVYRYRIHWVEYWLFAFTLAICMALVCAALWFSAYIMPSYAVANRFGSRLYQFVLPGLVIVALAVAFGSGVYLYQQFRVAKARRASLAVVEEGVAATDWRGRARLMPWEGIARGGGLRPAAGALGEPAHREAQVLR